MRDSGNGCGMVCMATLVAAASFFPALSAHGASDVRDFGVSGDEYLDLVEAAVAAYPDSHVEDYIDDADRNGVHEHGFPRLAANIAAVATRARLGSGVHTIRISNATAWTPDIDRMTVVPASADSASCGK